jgi:DNA-binding CsgD family transcriptional regulator
MSLKIEDPEAERLAEQMAERSGRSVAQTVTDALRAAFARTRARKKVDAPAATSVTAVEKDTAPDAIGDWKWLLTEPGVGVSILDEEQRLVFVDDTTARFYLDRGADGLAGRTMEQLGFTAEFIEDIQRVIDLLKTRGGPVCVRNLWKGRQILETYRRIEWPGEGIDHYVVIARQVGGEPPSHDTGVPVLEADAIELGRLTVLSPRELEVLCLIGQGLSTQQIALTLHRSPRTIEAHRRSIRNKLDESDRVKLAQAAHAAGLTLADAGRLRTKSPS